MLHNTHPSKNRKAAGGNRTASQSKCPNNTAINAHSQRQRMLKSLQQGSVSTLEARRHLDVLHPAARVQKLRERGHHIITYRHKEATDCGQAHSVASYILFKEAQ